MATATQAPATRRRATFIRPGLPVVVCAGLFLAALAGGMIAGCSPMLSLALAPGLQPALAPAAAQPLDAPAPRDLPAPAAVEPSPTATTTPEPAPTLTPTPLPTQTPSPQPTATATAVPPTRVPPTAAPTPSPEPSPRTERREGEEAAPPAPADPPPPAGSAPTRIVAPAVGLDVPVVVMGYRIVHIGGVAAMDWQVPMQAAGFHQGSAFPGRPGNTVVSGHSSSGAEVFRNLDGLQVGDTVILYVGETPYPYTISQREIVQEEGASYEQRVQNAQWILPTADERLTLITCWPYPKSTHRLILVGRPAR